MGLAAGAYAINTWCARAARREAGAARGRRGRGFVPRVIFARSLCLEHSPRSRRWIWPLYALAQGTMFWALFVVGHDWCVPARDETPRAP